MKTRFFGLRITDEEYEILNRASQLLNESKAHIVRVGAIDFAKKIVNDENI